MIMPKREILEGRIILNNMRGKIRMIPNKFNVLIKFEFGTINNSELVIFLSSRTTNKWVKGRNREEKTNKYISLNVWRVKPL